MNGQKGDYICVCVDGLNQFLFGAKFGQNAIASPTMGQEKPRKKYFYSEI